MSRYLTRATVVRLLIVVATVALTWGALMIGQQTAAVTVTVGEPSPQDFFADRSVTVVDPVTTAEDKNAAADKIETVYSPDPERSQEVLVGIGQLFDTVAAAVFLPEPEPVTSTTTTVTEPEITTTAPTTTVAGGEGSTTTTTQAPATTEVTGIVFLDADGNGVFDTEAGDYPKAGATVVITGNDGAVQEVETDQEGRYRATGVEVGTVVVDVDTSTIPKHFALSTIGNPQSFTAREGKVLEVDPIGFAPQLSDIETQIQLLEAEYPTLQPETRKLLVSVATGDVMRLVTGRVPYLAEIRAAALDRATTLLQQGLANADDLATARAGLAQMPPTVSLDGSLDFDASKAAGDVVSALLQINKFKDEAKTEQLKQEARDAVADTEVEYKQGEKIVGVGTPVTEVQLAAIEQLSLLRQTVPEQAAMLLVVVLVVGMLIFYLARFRAQFWAHTRRVLLFGLLIVLAALVARGVAILTPADQPAVGFLLPAAMFGFMAAILFDARIGVVMAMAVGALTGLATRDAGLTLFALLSAMTPIPFVSSISARGDLRKAIVYTALVMFPMAAGIAWFFNGWDGAVTAGLYGFANGLFLSGLIGVAAVSFLEIMFDVTTTLRLLDLTDRNHPALQMMEEEARGTFNHSLMVGTLADKAAKAIGANNLLARAAAYYHDLGKTQNPQFFIENQFGISNPHDSLPPEESAAIIRDHVSKGVELAKRYRIPTAVADGIVSHHGDGIMRYFYHKACERYGVDNVDVDDYRHYGHKPQSKEMAILMMADALESAARAVFADKDPTPDRIEEIVEQVVGEKVADGQLGESDLTLGELTRVKAAFVDSLVGYYHQRIPYPGFPDSPAESPPITTPKAI
ncbi:MAG: HDIG domain-containing protein [Actinobacteria bacterium]|nr:HDIG domain-containing protein [Actinomycetota bacterium]